MNLILWMKTQIRPLPLHLGLKLEASCSVLGDQSLDRTVGGSAGYVDAGYAAVFGGGGGGGGGVVWTDWFQGWC